MEKRNAEMDFFRGIGILLMIFVHVGFGNSVWIMDSVIRKNSALYFLIGGGAG